MRSRCAGRRGDRVTACARLETLLGRHPRRAAAWSPRSTQPRGAPGRAGVRGGGRRVPRRARGAARWTEPACRRRHSADATLLRGRKRCGAGASGRRRGRPQRPARARGRRCAGLDDAALGCPYPLCRSACQLLSSASSDAAEDGRAALASRAAPGRAVVGALLDLHAVALASCSTWTGRCARRRPPRKWRGSTAPRT